VALIAGPTASGKSDLAVRLALALKARGRGARIINADSSQVYSDLRILSARPSEAEMSGIPHRLFGERDGAQVYSAADWAAKARSIIFGCTQHGVVPILVGGTGLYIRALLEGIAPIPRIEPAVREAVRLLLPDLAYEALIREDPHRAQRLNPLDTVRVHRALEVIRSTGASLTYWQSLRTYRLEDHIKLHPAILLPDRQTLYERCDARFSVMMANGAVAEVEALLARHLDPMLPVTRAIGVREIAAFLRGVQSYDKTVEEGAQATRNYAKRQYTWFRNQSPAHWLRWEENHFDPQAIFASLLQQ
jgi:tRNA dimethylallyltransferase